MQYKLYSDGGARGNPGRAGIGFVLEKDGNVIAEEGRAIGEATNNVAEYTAILEGLKKAKALGVKGLSCFLDSELIVQQLNRKYKIKDPELGKFFIRVWNILLDFKKVTFTHIPREENKRADRLVNEAIDNEAINQKS